MDVSAPQHTLDSPGVDAHNRFALALFHRLYQTEQNLLLSPPVIAINLAMLLNGASGDTRAGIAQALSLTETELTTLNHHNQLLRQMLTQPDAGFELTMAQTLWARPDICFQLNFLQQLDEFYNSSPKPLSYSTNEALTEINNWVRDHTGGKIERLLSQLDQNARVILLSALYFKGQWQHKFLPSDTRDDIFVRADGYGVKVAMMKQTGFFQAIYEPTFSALRLPYGSGQQALYLFLPETTSNLREFTERLTRQNWQQWRQKFHTNGESNLTIMLPRFQLSYQADLTEPLSALGMAQAFDPNRADFSEMVKPRQSEPNLYLALVKQQAWLEVNEEGTTAAAAAASLTLCTGIPGYLIFNRPFCLALIDDRTGGLLFLGLMNYPNDNPPLTEVEATQLQEEFDRYMNSQLGPFYQQYGPKHHREMKLRYAESKPPTPASQTIGTAQPISVTQANRSEADTILTAEMEQMVLGEIKELSSGTVVLLLGSISGLYLGEYLGYQLGELVSYYLALKSGWSLPALATLVAIFCGQAASMVMLAVSFFCGRVGQFFIYRWLDQEVPAITPLQAESTRLLYLFMLILAGQVLGAVVGWPLGLLCGKIFHLGTSVTFIQLASLFTGGLLVPLLVDQNKILSADP